MPLSEAMTLLIINNSFILVGAVCKYIADSNCIKFLCCKGAIEVDGLSHINSETKQEADTMINSLVSTVVQPVNIGQPK